MGGQPALFTPTPALPESPAPVAPSPVAVSPVIAFASEAARGLAGGASAAMALLMAPLRQGSMGSRSTKPAPEATQSLAAVPSRGSGSGFTGGIMDGRDFSTGTMRRGAAAATTIAKDDQPVPINDDTPTTTTTTINNNNTSSSSSSNNNNNNNNNNEDDEEDDDDNDNGSGGGSGEEGGLVHERPETEESSRHLKRTRR